MMLRVDFRGLCGHMFVISIYRTTVTLRFPFAEVAVLELFWSCFVWKPGFTAKQRQRYMTIQA